MKNIVFLMILFGVVSIRLVSQNATYRYDNFSGNYIITFQQDTLEHLIFYPKTKINPTIKAWINIYNGTFEYNYLLTNNSESEEHLSDFYIPEEKILTDIRNPNGNWSNGIQKMLNMLHWSSNELHHYSSESHEYFEIGIPPGSTVSGFTFKSDALPGIVTSYCQGYVGLIGTNEELPGDVVNILDTLESFPLNYVMKNTIGPTGLPQDSKFTDLLDTLISYKHRARDLGWIDNDGIVNSLDQKLVNAKKQLERENTKAASNMVQAFINEVEAQKDKHLTSEAYALLKYNAEYLLEKMGGK